MSAPRLVQPPIGRRIPFADYIAIDAVNASALKQLDKSPAHYRHYVENGGGEETDALRLGTGLHVLVFEPELFHEEVAVWEGGVRRGKAWDAYELANAGKTILVPKQLDDVHAMADSVRRHPAIAPYLTDGEFEQTIEWTDAITGLPCKARIDWWQARTRTLLDLKSAVDASPRGFGNAAARLGYDLQLAHYKRGVEAVTGEPVERSAFVVVEKSRPFDAGLLVVRDDFLYAAEERLDKLLRTLADCLDRDVWPGRYPAEIIFDLPAYLLLGDEDEAETYATGATS